MEYLNFKNVIANTIYFRYLNIPIFLLGSQLITYLVNLTIVRVSLSLVEYFCSLTLYIFSKIANSPRDNTGNSIDIVYGVKRFCTAVTGFLGLCISFDISNLYIKPLKLTLLLQIFREANWYLRNLYFFGTNLPSVFLY